MRLCLKDEQGDSGAFGKNQVGPQISLKDWFDFIENAKDPAGTKGRIIPVTESVLAQHTSDSHWLALRGSVYCVTDFMKFHPGGKDRIHMGVGHDASMLFNIYHAHIDYDAILHRCYVGPLIHYLNNIQSSDDASEGANEQKNAATLDCSWSQDKNTVTFTINHGGEALATSLFSIFLSSLLCRFRVFSRRKAVATQWTFPHAVVPTKAHVEFYKADLTLISFPKAERSMWNLESIKSTYLSTDTYGFKNCTISTISTVAHNVLRFEVEVEDGGAVSIPIGGYMVWKLQDLNLYRRYSPVPSELQPADLGYFVGKLTFIVKLYPDSASSNYISHLKAGDVVDVSDPFPSLTLDTQRLNQSTQIALISGGTGINPFLRIVLSLLKNTSASVDMVAFFRKSHDVLWKDELGQLTSSFPNRLRVSFVVDVADPEWRSHSGGLSSDLLAQLMPTFSETTCACICGMDGFCSLVTKYLNQLGWNENAIMTL
ncbi:hypothetical protein M514_26223 [Trichuris suis]|uniref:Uncharacterized protein n=1 Tax=Trichuris suis TaxID=68888 RepID=A0A085MWL0_9BILA|nr:hypothetical protein M514_26223 [Trichuris suis]